MTLSKWTVVWAAVWLVGTTPWGAHAAPIGRIIPSLPAARWHVEAKPGDVADLTVKDGCLELRYDVDIKDLHQQGHVAHKQARIRLRLDSPVDLKPDEVRMVLEVLGNREAHNDSRLLKVVPLIRDASGETLSYFLRPAPHLKGGTTNWSEWMTTTFSTAEAGGATQDIFASGGDGDANAWPDGKLSFVGVDILIRRDVFGRQAGRIALGTIRTAGTRMPYQQPFAFADGFLSRKGDYTFAVSVSGEFQGAPLREFTKTVAYDPDSLASRKQRLEIPLGPNGDYWMTYQITDAAGAVVENRFMRTRVEDNPDATALSPVPVTQAPAIGYVRVNPDRPAKGVYPSTGPMAVAVRVFAKGAAELSVEWRLCPYAFDATVQRGSSAVSFASAPYRDLTLALTPPAGRDAYRLKLTVLRDGKVVDAQEYLLGRQTDFSKPMASRAGKILDRDYVKQSSYFRVTYTVPEALRKGYTEEQAVADFRLSLDNASQMTRYLTYMLALEDFEILPGVFDFALLDRVMDEAADRGCALTIRVGVHFVPAERDFTFLPYSRQRSFDGMPITLHIYGGGFSLTDDGYVQGWMRAFRALHDRYANHPGFQGYYLLQPCGEGTVFEKPWEGQIAGYESSSQPAFRRYLREERGLSLEQLNARWGTRYASWDEVAAPLPDFALGKAPDLRLSWLDFCLFKVGLEKSWFRNTSKAIRAYDTNHVLITYCGADAVETTPPGLIDYLHNGGNHFLQGEGSYVKLWEAGTGWISEPHHPHGWAAYGDPAEKGWVLDWTTYVMMAQAGGGGANLHVYYVAAKGGPHYSLRAHYGGWLGYDRFETFKPILNELYGLKLVSRPRQVGVLHDPYSLYSKHRTTFGPRLQDLRRWFELLKLDAVDYEDLVPANLDAYKLLLPNALDEVMSEENIRTLDRLVRVNGAKMIITAITGRACPERPGETFPLLRQLGIALPEGAYIQNETNVLAEVAEDNPLFARGARLKMFTGADQQLALQSDTVKVRENFWSWPFRWIPQTDYFGYYRDNKTTNGKVLARFPSGGVALSQHTVGKGEVIVFWGMPDYIPANYKGLMTRAAKWAGVVDPRQGSPIPYMLEGDNPTLGRHYAVMYHETPGTYRQKFTAVPDGTWFVDDMVAQQRFGTYTGKELREKGMDVVYSEGSSPLKVLRMITPARVDARWLDKYRKP